MNESGSTTTSSSKTDQTALSRGAIARLETLRRIRLLEQYAPHGSEGELMARLREAIDQLPELDATKVVRLHQRIMLQSYEIRSDRIAEKMLRLERLLGR